MKQEVNSFKIVCDCCGETFHDGNDFVCYSDDPNGELIECEAVDSGWMRLGENRKKHYCSDCYHWDDDDNIVTNDGHKYDGETYKEIKED